MNLPWPAFMSMAVQTSSAFYISCSFKKKIQISDSTAAAFTNAIALKFSLVLILLFCWIVFIQAPAFWLRMLGLNGREVLTRTRELKMFNVTNGTHMKIKIICFYCGSVFYFMLLFLELSQTSSSSEYFCFVSFLNVIGILWNSQFFNQP